MAHFAHFVRKNLVEIPYQSQAHPWFAENQPDTQGFTAPVYHVTRASRGAAARVRPGDTIWLFARLTGPGGYTLPPALDARIVVSAVTSRSDAGFRYEAGAGSRWFPLWDASPLLLQIQTRDSAHTIRPLLSSRQQRVGQALQSMRELADGTVVQTWERRIDSVPLDFISYRLLDGTRCAMKLAYQLLTTESADRPAVFWDRWSLPRRLAERREFLSDHALDQHIFRVIAKCRNVWGIGSPLYAQPGSYSEQEMQCATQLGKLQMYYCPECD